MINVHHYETCNYVNGAGRRFVIWVQGCSLHCRGCWNTDTWDFSPRLSLSVPEIGDLIQSTQGLDGVTFTGGEPFLQADELIGLAAFITQKRGLPLQIFTGFSLDELQSDSRRRLFSLADTVVYGRFDSSMPRNNQRVWNKPGAKMPWDFNNTDIEIDLSLNGDALLTGYPSDAFISELAKDIE